jgi:endonuclease/exonuclease/phosphatase family metal-dependent hydrolase
VSWKTIQRNLRHLRGAGGSHLGVFEHRVHRESVAAEGALRLMSLNVRHGRGCRARPGRLVAADFRAHTRLVADFLRTADADVVALQEADAPSSWSGSFHHVSRLIDDGGYAELLHGRHFRLDLARWGLDYGTALLSRHPLTRPASVSFRVRPLDTKGFVVAEVGLDGRPLDVVSLHLDVLPSSRRRQVVETIRRLRERGGPLVLMGDLNSAGRMEGGAARRLAADLGLHVCGGERDGTYPLRRPRSRIDWILASPELECREARVLDHSVSDHRAVTATVAWRESGA